MTNGQDEQVKKDKALQDHLTRELATEYVRSEPRYIELACRSLLILSGGAVLAILAFAGNAASQGGAGIGRYLAAYAAALFFFATSALLAVAAPFYYGGAVRSALNQARTKDGAANKKHGVKAERFDVIGRCVWQAGMVFFALALLAATIGTAWIACTAS